MRWAPFTAHLCLVFGLTLLLALHRTSDAALPRSEQLKLQSFLRQQPQTVRGRTTMHGPLWQPLHLPRKGHCWRDASAGQCAQGGLMLRRSASPIFSRILADVCRRVLSCGRT